MLPVTGVCLSEAMAYARWAGKRLPTEIEWEFAATGGHGAAQTYPWGAAWRSGAVNLESGTVTAVDGHPGDVTPVGIRGMAGNVSEWTLSTFGAGVIRGGSVLAPVQPELLARTCRRMEAPESSWRSDTLGFRGVQDLAPPEDSR